MEKWQMRNANGDVDPTSFGYDYAIRTTTQLRAKTIQQKFFEVAPADYMPVVVGEGAWMEEIRTNLEYNMSGDFESGIMKTGYNQASLPQVEVGMSNKNAKIKTWAKGYEYTIPELEMAMKASNWDKVAGKTRALKKDADLGIQKVAFLGLKTDATAVPGLLTNADVTINTTAITANISGLSTTDFQSFVANILEVYRNNANRTAWPTKFVLPESDYLGLGRASSKDFPIGSMIKYLEDMFRSMIPGGKGFQILPLAYGNKAINAGSGVAVGGKNRYVLYNDDPETLRLDIPVPFQFINPTPKAISFEGAAMMQFTGCIVYRPREVMYFDHD